MSATDELRRMLDERGVEHEDRWSGEITYTKWRGIGGMWFLAHDSFGTDGDLLYIQGINMTPEQAIAATLGRPKAKSHPYGYEPDTGAFDATRCECGCLNDISATYCNDCGGEIEIDMNAEKEIYHTPRHSVFVEKHDDGSLELGGKRYIAATPGGQTAKLTAEQVMAIAGRHQPDYCSDTHVCFDWQAIADELNAATGGGECEFVIEDNMNETEGMGDVWFRCTNCDTTYDYYADDWLMKQNHCPHCGFKIRKAVKQ